MRKRTFKFKIIIPPVIVIIILVVIINVFLSFRFSEMGNTLINEKLFAIRNSLLLYLEECEANTKVAAVTMAHDPEAVAAIKAHGRNDLLRIFNSRFDLYQVSYFTISDDKGTVLARTHDPDFFGDSIAGQRNVKDALDGKVSSCYEPGTNEKVTVVTGAPVFDADGTLIGAVSAGVRFDLDSEVEKLKNLFGSEATVFFGDTRIVTTITKEGKSIIDTKLDQQIAEIVIKNRQEYIGDADILGEQYKTFYKPLLNADGDAFATIFLGIPLAELIAGSNQSIRDGVILGLCGLVISIAILYFVISTISQPISRLSNEMRHIAEGNLNIDIVVKSNDEVGDLSNSLMKVAGTLRKLLDEIGRMIVEQKHGNIDYSLETSEFLGDYKTLADSILELADFGMKDQLTGIPNRRSLDNRLELEWERAVREKQPISLLMLDIDNFKNYNDSFGHQQGDLTLQIVAGTIKQALSRSVDFTARWGGEEFIVLLPGTDEQGAAKVAERIRKAVESVEIPCDDEQGRKATISIGVSSVIPDPDALISGFITASDSALYMAKETGRNRIVISDNIS